MAASKPADGSTRAAKSTPATGNNARGTRRRPVVHEVDPFADFEAERLRILSSPFFDTLVEQLVNHSQLQSSVRKNAVDDVLGRHCLTIAARFALLGMTRRGSAAEIAVARDFLEAERRRLPIPMLRGGDVELVRAPGAAPWQIALTRIFATGAFAEQLRPFPAGRLAQERRVLLAIERILNSLHKSVATPPRRFSEALTGLQKTKRIAELEQPVRDHVTSAVRWMMGLLRPHPTDGVTLGIAYKKRDERESRRFVSPWGAAVRFANGFGLIMPPRAHDVTRTR